MKLLKLILFTFLFVNCAFAEKLVSNKIRSFSNKEFISYSLLKPSAVDIPEIKYEFRWEEREYDAYKLYDIDQTQINSILKTNPSFIRLVIGDVKLLLYQVNITTDEFFIETEEGKFTSFVPMVHYRGIVENDYNSLASISISEKEVCGFYSNDTSNNVIGKLLNSPQHIVYDDRFVVKPTQHECQTIPTTPIKYDINVAESVASKCVKVYLEIDYDIYVGRGSSVSNVTTYIQGAFAQVIALYANDGMTVNINQIFVWTSLDPYTGPDTYSYLIQFANFRTSFNGDLGHLIGYQGSGGIAYLNSLCRPTNNRIAYSDVGSTYNVVPTYSWTVNVLAHEMGHNVASPHTHDCAWNNNNTALDGCGPAAGYSTSCPVAPLPTNGGTVMSYCHLISGVGINFNNGFGTQPAALMRNAIANASCLTSTCDTTTPPPPPAPPAAPSNLVATAVAYNQVNLVWTDNSSNEASFTIERRTGNGSYSTLATVGSNITSYVNSNTVGNTTYTYRVYATNTGGNSPYTNESTVTTPPSPGGCTSAPATPGVISGPIGVCRYQLNVLYAIQPVNTATNYTWTVPPGSKIVVNGVVSTGTTLTTTASTIGVNYGNKKGKISVKANNACGSSATRSLTINFVCREELNILNEDITLYPNPASTFLTLNFAANKTDDYVINVFDNVGKLILQQTKTYNEGIVNEMIDISNLNNGNYIFQLRNMDSVYNKRFIILK